MTGEGAAVEMDRTRPNGPRVGSCADCGRTTALALIDLEGGGGERLLCLRCLLDYRPCRGCGGAGIVRDIDSQLSRSCDVCQGAGITRERGNGGA